VDGGRLPRNVAAGIKPPKVQRKEMHFLTAAQVEALADAIAPPCGVLVRFAAYAGLRPCEFVALRVERLDLLRGTVRVAEAAPEVAGRLEWGGVKTHEARTVRLPRSVAAEPGRLPRRPSTRPGGSRVHRLALRPWRTLHGPSADQRWCRCGKALVSEAIWGCRRRGSNPPDPRFAPSRRALR
jgi:integrase